MIDEPAIQPAQVFGIIDPDYARVFTQARIVAWQYGYACLAHGTFTRDLDLLLVPWAEHASREIESIVKHLAGVTGLRLQGPPSDKPHGRKSWSLLFPAFEDVRWVDVSAFAAPVLRTDAATDAAPAAAQQAEPVGYFVNDESDDQWHQVDYEQRNGADTYPLYLHPPAAEVQQAEPVGDFQRSAPGKIWMNLGNDGMDEIEYPTWDALVRADENITWSEDRIDATDIPYVRADLAHPPAAEVQRLRDALTAICAVADDREEGNYDTVPIHFIRSIARDATKGGK